MKAGQGSHEVVPPMICKSKRKHLLCDTWPDSKSGRGSPTCGASRTGNRQKMIEQIVQSFSDFRFGAREAPHVGEPRPLFESATICKLSLVMSNTLYVSPSHVTFAISGRLMPGRPCLRHEPVHHNRELRANHGKTLSVCDARRVPNLTITWKTLQ